MNDEEFGRIAFLLCRNSTIDSDAIGEVLGNIYNDYVDEKNGDWKE